MAVLSCLGAEPEFQLLAGATLPLTHSTVLL